MSLRLDGSVDLGRFRVEAALDAEPGETLALVGPNGSGKSTTLGVLAGLRRLSTGTLQLDGTELDGPDTWVPSEHRGLGVVFQDLLLFPHLDALDNVAYGLRRRGIATAEARAAAHDLLERFGVADLARARPRSLSGGQAQRVALARSLAGDPRLLLLDEPLSALDTETRLHVRCELHRHLARTSGYALLVAHDVVDVLVLADRVAVFENGRIAQVGSPLELEHRPRTRFAAALVGTNLLRGYRRGGVVELAPEVALPGRRPGSDGPVDVVVSPRHVSVSALGQPLPEGSWRGTIMGVEAAGDEVHLRVGAPVPIAARVGIDVLRDLHLAPGAPVSVSIDPAGVTIVDDPSAFIDDGR